MSLKGFLKGDMFALVFRILVLLGCFATGTLTFWYFIIHKFDYVSQFVAFLYLLILTMVMPAAELGFMSHPDLKQPARFLYAPLGRGLVFIFMGGCILGHGAGGWVVGIYDLVIGVLSIVLAAITRNHAK